MSGSAKTDLSPKLTVSKIPGGGFGGALDIPGIAVFRHSNKKLETSELYIKTMMPYFHMLAGRYTKVEIEVVT